MRWYSVIFVAVLACSQAQVALSDELTEMVQRDLTALGYDTGGVTGSASTKTIIAVSRFQSERGLKPTGEITPQLAGVIQAAIAQQGSSGNAAKPAVAAVAPTSTPATSSVQTQADLKARQEACLEKKMESAQETAKLKSGLGKLFSAISRTASQLGAGDTAAQISTTTREASSVDATITDLEGAAKDLGVSQSDIDACKNA